MSSNYTITNSYGAFPDRSVCRVSQVVYPATEQELISAVATATTRKMKMKVITRFSHSIPKLVWPEGGYGLLVSTKFLNQTVEIDTLSMMMTPCLTRLYWWGLTVGGVLGIGAHGSTPAVHDYVGQFRIVTPARPKEGYAVGRTLADGDPELDTARVSLGVLGVLSQVTLRLQPLFKRSISYVLKDDLDLGDQVVYRIDDSVSTHVSGNGLHDFSGFRPTPSLALAIFRSSEETQELTEDAAGKCVSRKLTTSTPRDFAYGLTNDAVVFTGHPVVGYHNRLQSSGPYLHSLEDALLTGCPWDPRVKGIFFHQTAFSIAFSHVKSFIHDIQKLVQQELQSLFGLDLYNGILMRDTVEFDFSYYRSKDPLKLRLYEYIMEDIEQIGLLKYGGAPHWGKNRNLAFDGAVHKYEKARELLKVKSKFDPSGLFSSEWTDLVPGLKGGVEVVKEGCAIEGLCVRSKDLHCAPSRSYYCRPGNVYPDARVCTRLTFPKTP
ncbi:L-gulonolactone oxidase [Bertholletia excelsa]